MNKLLTIGGCCLLAVLVLPAFIEPPAHPHKDTDSVAVAGAQLTEALTAYYEAFGEFPSGGQEGIVRALRGGNPKERVFYECPPESLSPKGELLDPWGMPYRFTFEEETRTPRVHSAGPNRFFDGEHGRHSDDYRSWIPRD